MIPKRSTWFLPAERASGEALGKQVTTVASSQIVDALLRCWGDPLAVLNAQRQVVAVNGAWLRATTAANPTDALGLRPGEALHCAHTGDAPGGCGTSKACACCGAAAAVVAASARDLPEVRDCSLTIDQGGEAHDVELQVRAIPLSLGDEVFTLLSLRDVSVERRRASLERAYFHDLGNLVNGLCGAVDALPELERPEQAAAVDGVRSMAGRLTREVHVQRALAGDRVGSIPTMMRPVAMVVVVDLVDRLFRHLPAAIGKTLRISLPDPAPTIRTDADLLHRVLAALVLNAFEATVPGGTVRLTVEMAGDQVVLRVWNAASIPAAVLPRVFRRYFTTKPGEGRGQGTFIAKAFTERFLHGSLGVASSAEGGTAFEVRLPLEPPR